ncbi:hypothetical protein [Lysobacter enzymogenes]|uniref:hypothetical protein n=1 Tax=Lysobacter enzymogenes TaxID=69 RepID=UPI000BBB11FA|nr:hypothetical protein [Lysobacter enzymogenes]
MPHPRPRRIAAQASRTRSERQYRADWRWRIGASNISNNAITAIKPPHRSIRQAASSQAIGASL